MAICLRRLIPLATITMLVAGVLMLVGPAGATVPGANGLILWARFNPDLGDDDIYIANPDGTPLALLRGHALNSKKLGAVFIANADGTNARQITPWGLRVGDFAPRWSPDGSRLVFVANHSLFLVNPDGSRLRELFQDTGG